MLRRLNPPFSSLDGEQGNHGIWTPNYPNVWGVVLLVRQIFTRVMKSATKNSSRNAMVSLKVPVVNIMPELMVTITAT
jgi:hypothetical protein